MSGYMGKILRINLTTQTTSIINTSDYEEWGGGNGMGSAIFFDLVQDKTISAFDPANIVTIMTSPLSGTLTPAGASRTEVQGIAPASYPLEWFTRSNFGGRFSSMLKYAGWDGIVIEGASNVPVWVDIRDDDVQIKNCSTLSLWGMNTKQCQETIWQEVSGGTNYDDWYTIDSTDDTKTTQRPAVLTIGPAGENLSRMASLQHDMSHACGMGGFGAVWGSKNLKAISVVGSGSVPIHDPDALIQARAEQMQYAFDYDNPPDKLASYDNFHSAPGRSSVYELLGFAKHTGGKRPQGCPGCHCGCKSRYENGIGNESTCAHSAFYLFAPNLDDIHRGPDLLSEYGINAIEAFHTLEYIKALKNEGVLGPGKAIECPLNLDDYGSLAFLDQYLSMISYRNDGLGNAHDFGDTISEGAMRAAKKWGRLEQDLATGQLNYPYWGYPNHYDPRAQLEWGYGSILGDRDINEHCLYATYHYKNPDYFSKTPQPSTEEVVNIMSAKMVPFDNDPLMLDYSEDNMYSEHMAKLVAWHRYYTRFWKESMLFCDKRWPDLVNPNAPGLVGSTGVAEPQFLNAVTGKNFTFLDGMEIGRKIWNLNHSIWTLQGRHRNMVHFAEHIYSVPFADTTAKYRAIVNGQWEYISAEGRIVDRQKFEEFKTIYYQLEGWDTDTGYPTRIGLEALGMGYVADELEANCRLGKGIPGDLDNDCDVDKDDKKLLKRRQKQEKTDLKDQQKVEKDEMKAALGSSGDCDEEWDLDGDCDVDKEDSKLLKLQQKAQKTDLNVQQKAEKEAMKAALK